MKRVIFSLALLSVLSFSMFAQNVESDVIYSSEEASCSEVSDLIVTTTDSQLIFSWTNPDDEDFAKTLISVGNAEFELPGEKNESVSKILSGFIPGKDYDFTVKTVTNDGSVSEGVTLNVSINDLPPADVSNAETKIGDQKVAISWTNPADLDFDKVVFSVDGYEDIELKGTSGTNRKLVLKDLINDQKYSASVKSFDKAGNASEGIFLDFTPISDLDRALAHVPAEIKKSTDKHLFYIKDYVGKKLSDVGDVNWSGKRTETYGDAVVKISCVARNGEVLDMEDDKAMKNYVVVAQNVEPNTELNISYAKNSEGEEYHYVDSHNISEIELFVAPLNDVAGGIKLDHIPEVTKGSTDKHLHYIKDYVGRNLATVGYYSVTGGRKESYGDATIKFNFITEDGSVLPCDDADVLKKYVVKAQSLKPDTELNLVYGKDSKGKEYSFVDSQNINEIEFLVTPIDGVLNGEKLDHVPTLTKSSTDKHLHYIKDYVGRNLATVGYDSVTGGRKESYGDATVELKYITEDGSFVSVSDTDVLKRYIVIAQNVEPGTELNLVYGKDSKGNEYSFVDSQNIEEIEFLISPLDGVLNGTKLDHVPELTKPSTDRHLFYIKDYVGRNLATVGNKSFTGNLYDDYGNCQVTLTLKSEDGSDISLDDADTLKQYVVTKQSVAAGTELKLKYSKDSKGNEYENLIKSQSVKNIVLDVKKVY